MKDEKARGTTESELARRRLLLLCSLRSVMALLLVAGHSSGELVQLAVSNGFQELAAEFHFEAGRRNVGTRHCSPSRSATLQENSSPYNHILGNFSLEKFSFLLGADFFCGSGRRANA